MSAMFSTSVHIRNPFQATRLPPYLELFDKVSMPPYRGRLKRSILHRIDLFRWKRMLAAEKVEDGEITLRLPGRNARIPFEPRNTQFHSVYFPLFRACYEIETSVLLDVIAQDRSAFFDIGANWGHFALHWASRPGFCGQVHAFEANPKVFGDLRRSVAAAGLDEQITCHALGLSDRDGSAMMTLPDDLTTGGATLEGEKGTIPVKLAALDHLDLPPPDVIKMDVEGHEAAVLRGAVKTLKAHQPFLVFESWAGDRSSPNLAPLEELAALGYRFFQPIFLKGEEAAAYLSGYGNNHGMSGPARLGLWEFSPAERPLLHEQFNIFACPDGRMDDLQERFHKHIPLNLAE